MDNIQLCSALCKQAVLLAYNLRTKYYVPSTEFRTLKAYTKTQSIKSSHQNLKY